MKICYNNEQVEQAIIESNIMAVNFGYVNPDDMDRNLPDDLKAIKNFLSRIAYKWKAFRIYMLDENVKNEMQDEEFGYIITNNGKRVNVYYDGSYFYTI